MKVATRGERRVANDKERERGRRKLHQMKPNEGDGEVAAGSNRGWSAPNLTGKTGGRKKRE
jgi:hypothetical protein